jgi:hypothetical protein
MRFIARLIGCAAARTSRSVLYESGVKGQCGYGLPHCPAQVFSAVPCRLVRKFLSAHPGGASECDDGALDLARVGDVDRAQLQWARAFSARIHLHAADKQWIMRNDPVIELWDGGTKILWDGVTLVRCGGHFEGGTVLHWAGGAGGRGAVCAGDILTVTTDRKRLSFMRSYPNFIPLSARTVEHIGAALKPFAFEAMYGHYFDRVIPKGGKAVLEKSVARYVAAVEGKRGYE